MELLVDLCDECKWKLELAARDQDAQGYFVCEGCLRVFGATLGIGQVLCDDCKKEMT